LAKDLDARFRGHERSGKIPEQFKGKANVPRILVIGYGNSLRGDDGFGPLAADLIAGRNPPGITVITARQLGPELAPDLSEADHAVFLDAEAADEAGILAAVPVEFRDLSATAISHHLEPGSLLALTRAVYGHAPAATLVTATAANFDHGAEISDAVRAAAEKAAHAVASLAADGRFDAERLRQAFGAPR
jgi:hydrogenase maturation protease